MAANTQTGPIFVVGCMRSGTTLLRLMLTSHSAVAIPPEGPFLARMYPTWGQVTLTTRTQIDTIIDDLFAVPSMRDDWLLERDRLTQALEAHLPCDYRTFVTTIYELHRQAGWPKATIWGDKNPEYVKHLALIWELFPQARVVHIVRDGRAVFNSFAKANAKLGRTLWPSTGAAAGIIWRRQVERTLPHTADPRYYELSYERLVADSETELRQLCDFLDLPFEASMLRFGQSNRDKQLLPDSHAAIHQKTFGGIDSARTEAWRKHVSGWSLRAFEAVAGPRMTAYGYALSAESLWHSAVVGRAVWLWGWLVEIPLWIAKRTWGQQRYGK